MKSTRYGKIAVTILALAVAAAGGAAETVATAVYAKIGNGYKRAKAKDGSFKPEYYALSNGGLIRGTMNDITVDRVSYRDVAMLVIPLLDQQNYYYAKTKEQANLLLVLNWGTTLAPNGVHKEMNVAAARAIMDTLRVAEGDARAARVATYESEDIGKNSAAGLGRSPQWANNEEMAAHHTAVAVESQFFQLFNDDRVRDELNEHNARVLGYLDELADSNDIRRWAGGGDRYNDLLADVEESRYYIVISAYDFQELAKTNKKKLLWQTRVSVRSPGNTFDDSVAAMMRSAAKYFGQDSGKLVRGEETKGTVELGELKYLGEAKEVTKPAAQEGK
jgi:hypothetical protein